MGPQVSMNLRLLAELADNIQTVCRLANLSELRYRISEDQVIVLDPTRPDKCREFASRLRKLFPEERQ